MGRLAGKVAIITGAGQGVGLGIAQVFAREGADILITGRTASKLEPVVEQLRQLGARADHIVGTSGVRAEADAAVARAVELFGGLDILVNNAQTTFQDVAFEDVTDENLTQTVESGLYGTIHYMQAAIPHMKARGGGSIINTGSAVGIGGRPGLSAYAATKEGIRGLSRTAARELGKYRIRVNVFCPAAMSPAARTFLASDPERAAATMAGIPLGYLGECDEDIGPAILFLASDDSHYVTGQTINVDGGKIML